MIGTCLNFDARADEAQPLCACAAFSRNHAEATAAPTTSAKEGEGDEPKATKRPTDEGFARKKRSRINTNGDSAFASDDDEMSDSSGTELDTTSSTASTEDEKVNQIPTI